VPATISEDLRERVAEAMSADPSRELPVIITLEPQAEPSALEATGVQLTRVFENIAAVAGRVSADAIDEVASLPHVERIEYDHEVQAL
jgi:hypothetical protein